MTRSRRGIRGGANFGCIVWLVILGLVGYVLCKVVPVKIATSEFYDVMQEQAAFGSIKDPKFIEFEILQKADELKLPIKKDNLKITKHARARSRSRRTTRSRSTSSTGPTSTSGSSIRWSIRPLFAV